MVAKKETISDKPEYIVANIILSLLASLCLGLIAGCIFQSLALGLCAGVATCLWLFFADKPDEKPSKRLKRKVVLLRVCITAIERKTKRLFTMCESTPWTSLLTEKKYLDKPAHMAINTTLSLFVLGCLRLIINLMYQSSSLGLYAGLIAGVATGIWLFHKDPQDKQLLARYLKFKNIKSYLEAIEMKVMRLCRVCSHTTMTLQTKLPVLGNSQNKEQSNSNQEWFKILYISEQTNRDLETLILEAEKNLPIIKDALNSQDIPELDPWARRSTHASRTLSPAKEIKDTESAIDKYLDYRKTHDLEDSSIPLTHIPKLDTFETIIAGHLHHYCQGQELNLYALNL